MAICCSKAIMAWMVDSLSSKKGEEGGMLLMRSILPIISMPWEGWAASKRSARLRLSADFGRFLYFRYISFMACLVIIVSWYAGIRVYRCFFGIKNVFFGEKFR